ncbi:MAG: hypothetical protein ACM3L9_03230 [Deltaproteobacteria bacterium]
MSDPLRELSAAIRRISLTSTLGLYDESLALLRHMENRLAKTDARPWIPLSVHRIVTVPVFLFLRGLGQVVSGLGPIYFVLSILAVLGLFVSGAFPGPFSVAVQSASVAVSLAAVLLYMFSAPSTFCSSGVNRKHVGVVKDKLAQSGAESEARVEMILRNLRVFEERAKRRVGTYRWILGAAWAIYFAPAIARAIGVEPGSALVNRESALFAFGWLMLSFLAFDSYARGVDILFRSLELGCNEQLATLREQADRAEPGHRAQS